MRILLSLKHENIIDIKDFICENTVETLKDIYIIQVREMFVCAYFKKSLSPFSLEFNGDGSSQTSSFSEIVFRPYLLFSLPNSARPQIHSQCKCSPS